jgi:hypothetical protein
MTNDPFKEARKRLRENAHDPELIEQRRKVALFHKGDFEVVGHQAKIYAEILGQGDLDMVLLDGLAYLVAGIVDLRNANPGMDSTMTITYLLVAALGELTVAINMLAEGLHKSPEEIVHMLQEQALRVE